MHEAINSSTVYNSCDSWREYKYTENLTKPSYISMIEVSLQIGYHNLDRTICIETQFLQFQVKGYCRLEPSEISDLF